MFLLFLQLVLDQEHEATTETRLETNKGRRGALTLLEPALLLQVAELSLDFVPVFCPLLLFLTE